MADREGLMGFVAALLHDVRKIDLGADGTWSGLHGNLAEISNPILPPGKVDLLQLVGPEVAEIVLAHHRREFQQNDPLTCTGALAEVRATDLKQARHALAAALRDGETSPPKIALMMADGWQKATFQASEKKESYFERTRENPIFYPYWGEVEFWEIGRSAEALRSVAQVLGAGGGGQDGYPAHLDLKRLLEVQKHLSHFPHTTYIPHSPLPLHHRFTALLYLFIYRHLRQLPSPLDLEKLEFSLLRIMPDPLALLYRMRDVNVARRAIGRLREALVAPPVLGPYQDIVPDISAGDNPFEFFGGGDEVMLVTDRAAEVFQALQGFVDDDLSVRALTVEQLDLKLRARWSLDRQDGRLKFSPPEGRAEVEPRFYTHQVLGKGLVTFEESSAGRCQRCGYPLDKTVPSFGNIETKCDACLALRREMPYVLDLEKVAGGKQEQDVIGFVFLSLPPNLRQHAGEVAEERLIPDFVNRKMLEPGDVVPGPAQFFEYLAAVDDLQRLHGALREQAQALAKRTGRAQPLFAAPDLLAYVLHWDLCWPFLGWLNAARDPRRLRLDSCLTVVFCRPHMPFWSLMNRFARFRGAGQDLYFDAAGRSIVMFTAKEVNDIRRLSVEARKASVSNTELESLVALALNTELHELMLEIEARGSERKLGSKSGFPGRLRKALDALTYEPADGLERRRQKRAVFIKYIKRLKGGR